MALPPSTRLYLALSQSPFLRGKGTETVGLIYTMLFSLISQSPFLRGKGTETLPIVASASKLTFATVRAPF